MLVDQFEIRIIIRCLIIDNKIYNNLDRYVKYA